MTPFGQARIPIVRENILSPSCTLNMVPLLLFVVSTNQTVMCYNTRHYITKTHGRETLKSYIRQFKLRQTIRYFKIQDMIIKYEVGLFHNCSPFLFPFFEYLTSQSSSSSTNLHQFGLLLRAFQSLTYELSALFV